MSLASSTRYLLDASALYPLILRLREGLLSYKDRLAVLDLAVYEVDNVLWRASRRRAIKHSAPVAEMFEEVVKGLERLSIGSRIFEVLDIAAESCVTFYDASLRLHGQERD